VGDSTDYEPYTIWKRYHINGVAPQWLAFRPSNTSGYTVIGQINLFCAI
jgi:hypothetical protein